MVSVGGKFQIGGHIPYILAYKSQNLRPNFDQE